RNEGGEIEHDLPAATLERAQVALAIADQALHAGGQLGLAATAVEHGHFVAAIEGRLHEMRADEPGPAQHEHARHADLPCSGSTRSHTAIVPGPRFAHAKYGTSVSGTARSPRCAGSTAETMPASGPSTTRATRTVAWSGMPASESSCTEPR